MAGTTSISVIKPVQLVCCGKSTLTSLPLGLIDTTVPTLAWLTDPHLYLGVVTDGLTRTRSPTLISSRRAKRQKQKNEKNKKKKKEMRYDIFYDNLYDTLS